MSEQERPEWAKELGGWAFRGDGSPTVGVRTVGRVTLGISWTGKLYVCAGCDETTVIFPSPEAALRVANAIAKELGGWPGEEA